MESVVDPRRRARYEQFVGRRVLVTGHTGFKGSWLCEWLLALGADVHGVALPPEGESPLFETLGLANRVGHHICDIRDLEALRRIVGAIRPEFVVHLAAQSLVRRGYKEPALTWSTNVLGTLHVLEAAASLGRQVAAVVVTTDKVYRNREWEYAYREDDELGGHDPYSASKAACEIAVASWRLSFGQSSGVRVATARAGNVLGAGDWSADRIVPDCYRAWNRGETVQVRSPMSRRPWQHVLEPLSGYLDLLCHLHAGEGDLLRTCNFGPGFEGECSVSQLVEALANLGDARRFVVCRDTGAPHEAGTLRLSIERARQSLGWSPAVGFAETLQWTDHGYRVPRDAVAEVVRDQLQSYQARRSGQAAAGVPLT